MSKEIKYKDLSFGLKLFVILGCIIFTIFGVSFVIGLYQGLLA